MKRIIVLLTLLLLLSLPTLKVTENVMINVKRSSSNNPLKIQQININATLPLVAYIGTNNFILIVSNDTLYAVDYNTDWNILWSFKANNTIVSLPLVADFNGDGHNEISILDNNSTLYFLNSSGSLIYKIELNITLDNELLPTQGVVGDLRLLGKVGVALLIQKHYFIFVALPYDRPGFENYFDFAFPGTFNATIGYLSMFDYDSDENHTYTLGVLGVENTIYRLRLITFKLHGEFYTMDITFGNRKPLSPPTVGKFYDQANYSYAVVLDSGEVAFINTTKGDIGNFTPISYFDKSTFVFIGSGNLTEDNLDQIAFYTNGTYWIVGTSAAYNYTKLASNVTSGILADLNDDGIDEAILTLENGSMISIEFNSSKPAIDTNFYGTAQIIKSGLDNPRWPLLIDINENGSKELIVAEDNSISIVSSYNVESSWFTFGHDFKGTFYTKTKNDTDGDGLYDEEEATFCTLKSDSDSDDDLLCDFTEYYAKTNGTSLDSDSDGLIDGWEWYLFSYAKLDLDPTKSDTDNDGTSDSLEDFDGDNLSNLQEQGNYTLPNKEDTDDDNLSDWEEIAVYKTSPIDADTDNDGLSDGWEVKYGFDPLDSGDKYADPDDDGVENYYEFLNGTNPRNSDTDGDGMPDGWEIKYMLNPTSGEDATNDTDNDGLSNIIEFKTGLDPRNNDTDGDGMPDGWEYFNSLNPLDSKDNASDFDEDGLTNYQEYIYNTNPRNSDTDGDGMPDGWEIKYGFDPTSNDGFEDADNDGLSNVLEYKYGTDPNNPDTDGDGLTDGADPYPLDRFNDIFAWIYIALFGIALGSAVILFRKKKK